MVMAQSVQRSAGPHTAIPTLDYIGVAMISLSRRQRAAAAAAIQGIAATGAAKRLKQVLPRQ